MMNLLRSFAAGYTAKVLIALLIASFALWGVSGSILAGGNTVVQVGNTKVDTFDFRFAYENQLLQLSRQLQTRLTREQGNAFGLQESVLAQVVSGAVLDENSRKMGLGLSEKALAAALSSDPAFHDLSGQFSAANFQNYLRQTGLSEDEFLEDRKKVAMRSQIQEGTSTSVDVPEAFLNAVGLHQNQGRVFNFTVIGPDSIDPVEDPSEAQVSKFYEENKGDFLAPVYRKVVLLSLQAEDMAKADDITEEALKAAYESRKANLQTPEKRQIEQLVLKDQAEADKVSSDLAGGKSFDDILAELGKKPADIDLGLLGEKELPDEKVRKAAFSAELNVPTEPVQGVFGPVIVRVTDIQEAKTTPFEAIENELRQDLAIRAAGEEILSLYDAIEDERTAGTSVRETAQKLDLKVREIPAMDAGGSDKNGNSIGNLPARDQLLQQISQAEPGDDTQPVPVGSSGYVWYDVEEIIPERQKELDEVRDQVRSAWKAAELASRVKQLADEIADKIKGGQDFNTVLEATLEADSLGQNVTYNKTPTLTRGGTEQAIGSAAIREGFSGPRNSVHVAPKSDTEFVVLQVSEIVAPVQSNLADERKEQLSQVTANDILVQVIQDFQSRESVSVNRAAIEQAYALGYGHGGM